jgi:CheY-like chemotaxis protein
VIVVDDDRLVRTALLRSLRRLPGLTVTDFADPLEALEHARTSTFDFAILDLQMPEMDGVTLAQEIRSLQPHIQLVFMTANLTSELAARAALLTTRPLIGKPWSTADLRAALDLV